MSASQSSGETEKRTLLLLRLNSLHMDTLHGNQSHKGYRLLEVQCYHTRLGLGMGTTTAAHSDFDSNWKAGIKVSTVVTNAVHTAIPHVVLSNVTREHNNKKAWQYTSKTAIATAENEHIRTIPSCRIYISHLQIPLPSSK